ncbi:MAG: methyl-accepting chemotaxis protein [Desulfobacteraceae bacterium]|nr:methyl-accepting chemotaxis protein [Desulfobacteraceae bacterium]
MTEDAVPASPVTLAERLELFMEGPRTLGPRTEPDFMAVGQALREVYDQAGALSCGMRETVELLGDPESGVLSVLGRLAKDSLAELKGREQAIGANFEAVKEVFLQVANLNYQADSLGQIGLFLRVIGLNFNIECAHAHESGGEFAMVAQELLQLAGRIAQVAAEIAEDCLLMSADQGQTRGGIVRELRALTVLARETEGTVIAAVNKTQGVMERALAALSEAEAHSRAIAGQVGEVVVRIQLHDSMSQRLAHLAQAMSTVIATLRQTGQGPAEGEQVKALAGAWRIVVLQGGQLDRIIEEIEEAGGQSIASFQVIDQEIAALNEGFAALGGEEQEESLSFLHQSLAGLGDTMGQAAAIIATLKASTGQVGGMVGRLDRHMRQIEDVGFEIHLKALNAIIKAAGLFGDCSRILDVLALETKELADRAGAFVARASQIHQAMGGAMGRLRDDDDGDLALKAQQGRLTAAVDEIAGGLADFRRDTARCASDSQALRQTIGQVSDRLRRFLPGLVEELSDQRRQLEAFAEEMAVWGRQLSEVELNEVAIGLMQLYTTDQERELHAAFLGISEAKSAEDGKSEADEALFFDPPAAEGRQEELGDNVELF